MKAHPQPAQIGDLCLLIQSSQPAAAGDLYNHQRALHNRYGGTIIEPVHLTCQRFAGDDERQWQQLLPHLRQGIGTIMPFPLTAVALQTLAVPVLQTTILKWVVDVTPALLQFHALVNDALQRSGITGHYPPGFTSSLVAALRDIAPPMPPLHDPALPYPLFTADQIALSRILGPNEFAILATLSVDPHSRPSQEETNDL
jgi:hypothetical protein